MAGQNILQIDPASASVNQGQYGVPLDIKRWKGFMITPSDYALTPANVAGIKAKLQADVIATDPDDRIQVIGIIDGCVPKGSEPVSSNSGYGLTKIRYGGQYAYEVTFADSDMHMHENRQKLNDRSDLRIMPIDEEWNLMATMGGDGSGNIVYQGASLHQWYANDLVVDGNEIARPTVMISLADSKEWNRGNLIPIKLGFNPFTTLKNVQDVILQPKGTLTTRVISIAPVFKEWGGGNLAQKYPSALASTSMWIIEDADLGTSIATTSATKAVVDNIDVMTVTASATGYPSSGGRISIKLASPTVLAAAGIKYFESDELILTV